MTETETLPSPADARDFAEYKRVRKEKDSTPQPVAKTADSPSDGDNSESGAQAESGSVSETGEETQKTEDRSPKRDRSKDGRISELTGKLKTSEEGRRKLELTLEELRKGNGSPEAPRQQNAETVKTPPAAAADTEPDLGAFIDEAIKDTGNKTYEQAQSAAFKKYWKAMREHEAQKTESERAQNDARTSHDARLAKTRERHGDFDKVVGAAIPQVEGIHNPGIEAAMEASDSADVVYYFATHLDEFRRIAQMKPQAAYRATVALDLKLASENPSEKEDTPETHAPPASRAPAPPPQARGATSHNPKSPAGARDYAEYKRLRRAQGAHNN